MEKTLSEVRDEVRQRVEEVAAKVREEELLKIIEGSLSLLGMVGMDHSIRPEDIQTNKLRLEAALRELHSDASDEYVEQMMRDDISHARRVTQLPIMVV